ncbi:zyxin-like [Brassica napus]|uniref:zyxin-like n=1 Tax=Brassica napus TaxID=3708 RepID=UPI00207865F4|nr:zyxin-like [Brassica napus]
MLLLVGILPRMTRSVSRRGEELLKAQRSSLSLASASPTPRSLPPVRTRRSNVSESACVSVTNSPHVLPSKPEPPYLFPVEKIKPLLETFPPPDPPPPDPPFKTPSPPEPPDPPLKAPSPMCPLEPVDPPDVLFLNAPLRFCDTSSGPSLQALFQISTVKLPCRIATKSGGGAGAHVSASDTLLAYGLLSPVLYRSIFGCVDSSLFSSCFDLPITPPLCSSLTGSIPGVGVMFVYLSFWWQVEEKLIFIFNLDVAGYNFPLIPRLNQSSFLILPPIWSELDEQALLVLQGSSSHRMLFSAYGAVCVVLWVTLDAIFEVAYDVVVIRSHMVSFCDLCSHSYLLCYCCCCLFGCQ